MAKAARDPVKAEEKIKGSEGKNADDEIYHEGHEITGGKSSSFYLFIYLQVTQNNYYFTEA